MIHLHLTKITKFIGLENLELYGTWRSSNSGMLMSKSFCHHIEESVCTHVPDGLTFLVVWSWHYGHVQKLLTSALSLVA